MSWLKRNPKNKAPVPTLPTTKLVVLRQGIIGVALLTTVGLLGYGVWHLTRVPSLTIQNIEVVGGQTIDHGLVTNAAYEVLQGTYTQLIPKRFVWLYPHDTVVEKIMTIDRIKKVEVERDGTTLHVLFDEYLPVALWCQELSSSNCLFLDRYGFAFAEAPNLQGSAFLRYSEVGRVPEVRTNAFTSEFIDATNAFVTGVYETLDLHIMHVEKMNQDHVTYHIAGGGSIKATLLMDTQTTLENLVTILQAPEFADLTPGSFKYIDLRYGNKVFVNEVMETETATSAMLVATSSTETTSE